MAMDPSSVQHHHDQDMSSQTLESMLVCTKQPLVHQEKKPRPLEQAPQKCPRCDSTNTKFCYYNNYSLTQPRYFCKSCRRYWTKGGTLRNVPVGGGCRRKQRSSSSSSKRIQDHDQTSSTTSPNQFMSYDYPSSDHIVKQASGQLGYHQDHDVSMMCNNYGNNINVATSNVLGTPSGFLDALRGGFLETPNGFHNNMYYGNVVISDQEMGMHSTLDHQDIMSTTTTSTRVKQEMDREGGENRVLWGFPWQINGDGFDSSRATSWHGYGGSSWHGLINSPLM